MVWMNWTKILVMFFTRKSHLMKAKIENNFSETLSSKIYNILSLFLQYTYTYTFILSTSPDSECILQEQFSFSKITHNALRHFPQWTGISLFASIGIPPYLRKCVMDGRRREVWMEWCKGVLTSTATRHRQQHQSDLISCHLDYHKQLQAARSPACFFVKTGFTSIPFASSFISVPPLRVV